ncbi:SMI1 / KNR4 family (SUKH-1) [bacterium A37T11]|nr:SMI1 / KNR4 family (SUKH-1) [bacterium A37T11]
MNILPQNSWWIQRLAYDKYECEKEIIAYAEGDVFFEHLNLDYIHLQINLTDETYLDRVSLILVNGNVIAKNIFNEETDGAVSVMVLGNLEADNILVGGQEIYVTGNLIVHNLFWGDYNHGELIVEGNITAKVLMASDYNFDSERFYNNENINVGLLIDDNEAHGVYAREIMETAFKEECLLKEEEIDEEIYSYKNWLNTIELINRLHKNTPILHDKIKALPEDNIPFVFENYNLTDNHMERFRISDLFALFGDDETHLKELEFEHFDTYKRVRTQPNKPFSTNIYLQYKQEYAVMIFYFNYEGNLRRGIVYKSFIEEDKEWHTLDLQQTPLPLKEFIEKAWKNLLLDFSAAEYYQQQFSRQITVQDIYDILALPVVKKQYSDYYNDEGKSYYIGNLMVQFRQNENIEDGCPRISIVKSMPYAKDDAQNIFYHLDINKDESGTEIVTLNTQYTDGYDSEVYHVSITHYQKYKEILSYFAIIKKKLEATNKKYLNRSMVRTQISPSSPIEQDYSYLEQLWQNWIDSINQFVPKDNEYYNLTEGISQEEIEKYTIIDDSTSIPEELLYFYRIQNVEYHPVTSAFSISVNGWDYYLIPFQDISEEWNIMDFQEEEDFENDILIPLSEKLYLNGYTNPRWIPFATGMNGDYLLYDTDPSEKGKYGQIVELQNESWQRNVVANSLKELIEKEIKNLKKTGTTKFDFILGKSN